ncbi:MAG TPA: rhomboid family intramembrane serine protease [Firmicutes bacterium]|nr:rhomboid family intramembrane serine protease [Bacillota bacterium]
MNRYFGNLRRFLNREYIPVTKGIVVGSVVLFIAHYFLAVIRLDLFSFFQFSTFRWFFRPWTILTYPLVNPDLLSMLFGLLWLWYVGGSLERSWGGQTYGFFLGLATVLTGLAFALVSWFFRSRIVIAGLWLPLTGLTWAWAKLYPDRELLFWGIFPIKAQWLSWLQAGIVFFFNYFRYHLGYALAAVSSVAVVYLFSGRGPFAHGLRYWAWSRNLSGGGWREKLRDRWRKRRFKVMK